MHRAIWSIRSVVITRQEQLGCVVVSYRRHDQLARVLRSVCEQALRPDNLVVVDNEGGAPIGALVDECRAAIANVELVCSPVNVGPAGGLALGVSALEAAGLGDGDWVIRLDDDCPFVDADVVSELWSFANRQRAAGRPVAAVGAVGSRFDDRSARLVRVSNDEVAAADAIPVSYLATNNYAMFSIGAMRAVGGFDSQLFYGHSEVEFGRRLRRHGYELLACGDLWRRLGRQSEGAGASFGLSSIDWRRYYSLRNQTFVAKRELGRRVALRKVVSRALIKPAAHLLIEPRAAQAHLRLNLRAVRDGWFGRLGRRLETSG